METSAYAHDLDIWVRSYAYTLKFLVKGIVYQADGYEGHQSSQYGYTDMIHDGRLPQLREDMELFNDLGVNTIFVCGSIQVICTRPKPVPDALR